jgi:predicted RNA binding protein YcfA (HicA-like mRNA interferase family)
MISTKKMIRDLSQDGWSAEFRPGGHIVFRHPDAGPVFASASPSGHTAIHKIKAQMRRALKQGRKPCG